MTVTKKFITLCIASALFLSGCTTTGPQLPEKELQLYNTKLAEYGETGDIKIDTSQTNQQGEAQQVLGEKTQITPPKGSMPVKELKDFETISAQTVTLQTTKGDITFEIYADQVPLTAQNFLNLAKAGVYDGIVFHRVIADFMAQVGDPLTKQAGTEARWGTGGPGYVIADEFSPDLKHDGPGVVSMANSGPNTGGSQFFITHEATPWLDGKHAVFGKVTNGLDVLMKITQGDKYVKVSYQ